MPFRLSVPRASPGAVRDLPSSRTRGIPEFLQDDDEPAGISSAQKRVIDVNRADRKESVDAQRDMRDFLQKQIGENRLERRFQFDIAKDKLDRENAGIEKMLNRYDDILKTASGEKYNYIMNSKDAAYKGLSPYHQKRFEGHYMASPSSPINRQLRAFDKANPPEPRPDIKENIVKDAETGAFEVEVDPNSMFTMGDWALRKERRERDRLRIETGVQDNSPIRIPMPGNLILTETDYGGAQFTDEAGLKLQAIADSNDTTVGAIRANGYQVPGKEATLFIDGQAQIHQPITDVMTGGITVSRRPAREEQTLGTTSDVNPFGHLPDASQKNIAEFQSKFLVGMDDLDNLKTSTGNKDTSIAANTVRDISRRVDANQSFKEISEHLSSIQPGINYAIIDPKEFDKFTWYNPLDILDPRHISARIKGALGTGIPTGFYKGSWFGYSEDIHIKAFPGHSELFSVPGKPDREYIVNEPESGVSQVYSKNLGILLGTRKQVQDALSR